ncbi:MAG: 4Fe-4S binding protein [Candidatus Pacebacteria bacterium]|jgi:pyruvate ferredoxin oxidoreductase delta subunit|nr:4Fe-4S binding protein [Candidatus Paceibacterota bacterium]
MKLKRAKEIPIGGKIIEPGNSNEVKTGSWKSQKPVLAKDKCVGCLRCATYCPEMAIKIKEVKDGKGGKKNIIDKIDLDYCKGCGICANECPMKAITMETLE